MFRLTLSEFRLVHSNRFITKPARDKDSPIPRTRAGRRKKEKLIRRGKFSRDMYVIIVTV